MPVVSETIPSLTPPAPQPRSWLLLSSGPGDPSWNMALDEALLEAVAELGCPVLRFYAWTIPVATFGYFQKYAEVERMTALRPLIRRPTGGGLVPHDADWTYSVVFPPSDPWHRLRAVTSYARLHEWIRASFARLGVASELATHASKERPGACFAGPDKFDVVWQGRKVAGAAQRRNRHGLLIQGSIQPPSKAVSRADWERALCVTGAETLNVTWQPFTIPAGLEARARALKDEKYSRPEYNLRRTGP